MEYLALAERHRRATLAQNTRAVLIAVTLRRLQGQDANMEEYLPELEAEASEAMVLRKLAYFEGLAANPPRA